MTTAIATATTDERLAVRLAQLTKARAERKDDLDLPRTMTQREVNAYLAETTLLDGRIRAIQTAAATLAALGTGEADVKWLANLNTWRTVLCDELMTIKSPIRDRDTKERADRLTFSIRLIDFGLGISTIGPIISLSSTPVGELMAAAGYETEGPALHGPNGWRGSLKEVKQRIKTLTRKRAEAQAALDVLLRTDEEQATHDAEVNALRAALNTMHLRGNGPSLVAFTLDDDPLDVSAMTEAQRNAFEWFKQVSTSHSPRETEA